MLAFSGVKRLEAREPVVAYDMQMAKEICDQQPLSTLEGIWTYPDDNIVVLILEKPQNGNSEFPSYDISVVRTSDVKLHPGDIVGDLTATPQKDTFKLKLYTEKNNDILLKPKSCLAVLSKDEDALLIKKQKIPFKGRLNLNFNRLLPGFWKIVSTGISSSSNNGNVSPAVGMVKIYPSYDGNGSSKRKPRYL